MPFTTETLRARFGVRAFGFSLVVLGVTIIGTGLIWRANLMRDLVDGAAVHMDSVVSDLETLEQVGQFPPRGPDPYTLAPPEQGVQVLSVDGEVVAASAGLEGTPPIISAESVIGGSTTVTTVIDHADFGHVLVAGESYAIGDQRYAVEAIADLSNVDRTARLTFVVGPIGAFLVASAVGLGVGLAIDRALRPVRSLTRRAAEIATGRRPLRLEVAADTSELRELSTELDRLLDAIRAAFDREQAFLDDASHELRTPLTIARTELELALRTTNPGPDVREALESAVEELDRVQTTASELLVLARARSAGERGFEMVDLRSIADQAAELVRRDRRRCSRRIEVEGSGRALGDGPALERALVNLIGNAVDHAESNVQVEITDSQPEGLQITIADDGPGFPDHLLDHIFDRFTRGPDRRAHGTGLGTAIAAEVISTHGGSVDASNAAAGGAVVTIVLPAPTDR